MKKTPRPPLAQKRKEWAASRGGAVFRGKPLRIPAGVAERYSGELIRLVNRMSVEYQKEVQEMFESPVYEAQIAQDANIASQSRILTNRLARKFKKLFDRKARELADKMLRQVDKASSVALKASLKEVSGGLTLKTSAMPAAAVTSLNASVVENVALIKSIPEQYASSVQQAVMRSITSGNGLADLGPELQRIGGITERRAKNIAHDQTAKAYSAINRDRMKGLGIRQFEWLHSGGGQHPRELHERLSGQIFSFDDPPVIDERTGEKGFPGQLVNCRCLQLPVISTGDPDDANES